MQSKSPVFLIIVAVLTALSIWGFMSKDFSYGLDVKGGVRLTYSIEQSSFERLQKQRPGVTKEAIQHDLVGILEGRVGSALGVVEGAISPKGSDQIIVEVPGYTDIKNAQEALSSTAKVIVYHAKNVTTPRSQRLYTIEGVDNSGKVPIYQFKRGANAVKNGEAATEEERAAYKRMIDGWEVVLEGAEVSDARIEAPTPGVYQPSFHFSSEGARKMEAFSSKYRNQQENIAFVLDGNVLSIAHIRDGAVLSDSAVIEGQFDSDYLKTLTALVKAGALPVDLKEESALKVDPTIGAKAFDQMVIAGLISFAITCLFLIVYYAFPGIIATVGMLLYVLFSLTVLKMMNATFSLASIAGLILSIAMAVDANILVFERLKEEMKAGKPLQKAAELGFKQAFSAIFDSNSTTIMTSAVLWFLGTGPVKGFATTLIIGVLISFLTAFAITRSILLGLLGLGIGTNPKWYAMNRSWFGEKLEDSAESKPIDILGKRNLYFAISFGLVAIGAVFIGLGGIKPNVEFAGGYEAVFQQPAGQPFNPGEIRSALEKDQIKDPNIKSGEGKDGRLVYVTVPLDGGLANLTDAEAVNKIAAAANLPIENSSYNKIGPTVQQETINNAIKGVVISSLLILFFLAIRFGVALGGFKNGIKFGLSATIALMHDVLFVIGLAAAVGYLLGWEVSALFITAMLTVIGFSVHDTIVIYDRIRENLRKPHRGQTFEHLVNKSITQSFARSINTSFTAILSLIILIAIGTTTPDLKFMCVTMLAGILVGTYSSIFNASPILYMWDKATIKRKGEAHGLMAESAREQAERARAVVAEQAPSVGGQYGQVKRKSAVDKATRNIDEE